KTNDCDNNGKPEHPFGKPRDRRNGRRRNPKDPNDISGPDGFGDAHFVAATVPLAYTVRFQNQATATAPAQNVVITEQLDTNLDWRTFRLTSFGWGGFRVDLPGDQPFVSHRYDFTGTLGFFVDVNASIDVQTGVARWSISTIDP